MLRLTVADSCASLVQADSSTSTPDDDEPAIRTRGERGQRVGGKCATHRMPPVVLTDHMSRSTSDSGSRAARPPIGPKWTHETRDTSQGTRSSLRTGVECVCVRGTGGAERRVRSEVRVRETRVREETDRQRKQRKMATKGTQCTHTQHASLPHSPQSPQSAGRRPAVRQSGGHWISLPEDGER